MSESLLSIKTRLSSVRSIGKMTKAMKLIATARYTKWKSLWDGNKPYEQAMRESLLLCLQRVDFSHAKEIPHCMMQNNSERKLYIFVTSTLGLCGAYNHNLFKFYDSVVSPKDDVIFIGEKGYRHYASRQHKAYTNFMHITSSMTYDDANEFRHWLDTLYREGQYESVNVIYTKFKNSISMEVVNRQILPLTKDEIPPVNLENIEPMFEPDATQVVNLIAPHYMDALIYRIFLESNVSEQSARRNSMDNATSSADKLTQQLRLTYNKMRQAKITQEITEVVGGANATK